jgi:phospholipase D1/2
VLEKRLGEPDGPEVILVLRELSHGWLEELTMQTLRTRLIRKLREADRYDRFRVYCPFIAGLPEGTCIDVHSKMIVVDDDIVRIGSANIANRSMGLDTECDLTIAANGDEAVREQIRQLRFSLLSEHLGYSIEEVQSAVAAAGSLRGAIERLPREDRTLKPLTDLDDIPDSVLNVVSVADPERPVAMQDLVKVIVPDEASSSSKHRRWKLLIAVAAIACLTALWKFTPLSELLEPQRITAWAKAAGDEWWAPLLVIAAYTPASIVMFPRPVITLFAVVAFGPWLGFAYAMTGIELAAWLTYVAGRRFSRNMVRRVSGPRMNRVVNVLRNRGLLAITALRMVPLAPFSVEGIVAGALRIKLWHFMLGTAIGILPGTLAATIFGGQLEAALENPHSINYWLIAGAVALLAGATWFVRRWLVSSSSTTASNDMSKARTA